MTKKDSKWKVREEKKKKKERRSSKKKRMTDSLLLVNGDDLLDCDLCGKMFPPSTHYREETFETNEKNDRLRHRRSISWKECECGCIYCENCLEKHKPLLWYYRGEEHCITCTRLMVMKKREEKIRKEQKPFGMKENEDEDEERQGFDLNLKEIEEDHYELGSCSSCCDYCEKVYDDYWNSKCCRCWNDTLDQFQKSHEKEMEDREKKKKILDDDHKDDQLEIYSTQCLEEDSRRGDAREFLRVDLCSSCKFNQTMIEKVIKAIHDHLSSPITTMEI